MAHDGERPSGTRVSDPDLGNEHIGGRLGPEGPAGRSWFALRPAATGPNRSPPTASPRTNTSRLSVAWRSTAPRLQAPRSIRLACRISRQERSHNRRPGQGKCQPGGRQRDRGRHALTASAAEAMVASRERHIDFSCDRGLVRRLGCRRKSRRPRTRSAFSRPELV